MNQYQININEANLMLANLKRKINTLALTRLGVILVGSALIFWVVQQESIVGVIGLFFAVIMGFAALVLAQSREEEKRTRWNAFLAVNEHELAVEAGAAGLYGNGASFAKAEHPYTDDLDVYGASSLYAMTNRCATPEGNAALAEFFQRPADRDQVLQRQEAVRDLASDGAWIQQLQVDLYPALNRKENLKHALLHYVAEQGEVLSGWLIKRYVQAAPFLVLGLFVVSIWQPVFMRFGIWLMIAHLLGSLWFAGRTNMIAGRFDKIGGLLKTFSSALVRIEEREWQSKYLQDLRQRLRIGQDGSEDASKAIKKLADILGRLDYRLNMLVGALMNMVFLWDFRQILVLQEWKKEYGAELVDALDVVGELEAVNSLAVLSINHSDWVFPEVLPAEERVLSFNDMNHPLIPSAHAVANSYSKSDHHIALITGSNMAGKSTFLRTVGVNTILALCGAPVCASEMRVSVMYLITYMRIKDSLHESTSTFKAELDRMKMILQTIRQQPYSFFLIDEMLRGTNSVDKYRGSKAVIERLVGEGASGMVATHDLQLASLETEYPAKIKNYHFDILVKEGEMLFDYKLKDGECKVFNASILLRGIGIDVDSTSPS